MSDDLAGFGLLQDGTFVSCHVLNDEGKYSTCSCLEGAVLFCTEQESIFRFLTENLLCVQVIFRR